MKINVYLNIIALLRYTIRPLLSNVSAIHPRSEFQGLHVTIYMDTIFISNLPGEFIIGQTVRESPYWDRIHLLNIITTSQKDMKMYI